MALFITFEGGEGSGKSTQAKLLYRRLHRLAVPVLLSYEPGVTPLGRKIARLLKWAQDVNISPVAELLLFNASRAQLISEVIRPNLESGGVVICDRYADSTTAYQGYGRKLDLALVAAVNEAGTMGLKPDLTILLDMPVRAGLARKQGKKQDRFEGENKTFHQRVREGYLKLANAEPERWLVVDAEKSQEEIAGIIWESVRKLLPRKKRV
jgi:dTMP kinase